MPREGIERIILKAKGVERQLGRRVVPGWELGDHIATQRLFLASPRGSYLAYVDRKGVLRVRDRRGREHLVRGAGGRDARFSADERHLATARSDGTAGGFEVVVLDTASGRLRAIGSVGRPEWMEWVKDGVVVSHLESADEIVITYLPLAGKPVEVASGKPGDLATRFTTAKLGHRAMYFFQKRAFLVDVQSQEADSREAGELPREVENVEMAPDGSEAAVVVAGGGIYRWREGEELVQLGMDPAHTVWYSADGKQLAYASWEKAVVLDGDSRHEIESDEYDLNAMRFHGGSLLVSMGSKAFLWNPKLGSRKVVATSGKGRTMQAADLYQGGVIVWTRELRRIDRRRAAKQAANAPFALAD